MTERLVGLDEGDWVSRAEVTPDDAPSVITSSSCSSPVHSPHTQVPVQVRSTVSSTA